MAIDRVCLFFEKEHSLLNTRQNQKKIKHEKFEISEKTPNLQSLSGNGTIIMSFIDNAAAFRVS